MAKHFGSIDRQQAHNAKVAATQRIADNDPRGPAVPDRIFPQGPCHNRAKALKNGAGYRIRTRGPLITNQVLYQLS